MKVLDEFKHASIMTRERGREREGGGQEREKRARETPVKCLEAKSIVL